ncbi:MAG: hypothetical protein LBC49_00135, partial [Bacteroidales bacterium]|nr:hypothetical protein [Bacteroidales bacterium]
MKTKSNLILVVLVVMSIATISLKGQGVAVTVDYPFFEDFNTTASMTLPAGWATDRIAGTGSIGGYNWITYATPNRYLYHMPGDNGS